MEADWEVEIGGGAPVIDACWPGFVDLGANLERVWDLPEVRNLPALGGVLALLNGPASPVWTAKCDVWPLDAFDPDELDAPREPAWDAIGCYIDLLSSARWNELDGAVAACKALRAGMRSMQLRCCRADLVVRQAMFAADTAGYGITAYLTACGKETGCAARQLSQALVQFADSVMLAALPNDSHQRYNRNKRASSSTG